MEINPGVSDKEVSAQKQVEDIAPELLAGLLPQKVLQSWSAPSLIFRQLNEDKAMLLRPVPKCLCQRSHLHEKAINSKRRS